MMFFKKKKTEVIPIKKYMDWEITHEELNSIENKMINAYSESRKGKDLHKRLKYLEAAEEQYNLIVNYCEDHGCIDYIEAYWMHLHNSKKEDFNYIDQIHEDMENLKKRIKDV